MRLLEPHVVLQHLPVWLRPVDLRRLLVRILRDGGYTVLEAEDPTEAIRMGTDLGQPLAALVTDIVMPTASGHEVAQSILKVRPEVVVIFTSGYTGEVVLRHGVTLDDIRFLPKPYTPKQVLWKLRDALRQSGHVGQRPFALSNDPTVPVQETG